MSDIDLQTVISRRDEEGIRVISLNRPERLNAMTRQLLDDVTAAFNHANDDPGTKVIIFTGEGRAFCAGDDRKDHSHPESEAEARDLVDAIQAATIAIAQNDKPVVGAINGWAVGGGFEWAINCDFPIWAKSAGAFFPEVSLNLFVTGAVTTFLPALVGLNRAREMLMLGARYDAKTLLDYGVAWRVVDDHLLMHEAFEVARKLAAQPAMALQAMKHVLNRAGLPSIDKALLMETDATVAGFLDPETTRLVKAGF